MFSLDSIFDAWTKFRRGKSGKIEIIIFELHLEDNLFRLCNDLQSGKYKHSKYEYFQIFDNKKRDIYKANIRDRIVHQIIFDYLISLYDVGFISDSYASRKRKGQYRAINAFRYFIKLALSNSKRCFVLKCDVRKYFDNIDQDILFNIITEKISCDRTLFVIKEIISSYVFSDFKKGIPLGNITSQIFANIYLDLLDRYIKKELRFRYYVRYNDDFVIISSSNKKLQLARESITVFVKRKLLLDIPFEKTSIRKISWGVDFLGYTILPTAVLLRNKTKSKMLANVNFQNVDSYFGILTHCNSFNLKQKTLFVCLERKRKIC